MRRLHPIHLHLPSPLLLLRKRSRQSQPLRKRLHTVPLALWRASSTSFYLDLISALTSIVSMTLS